MAFGTAAFGPSAWGSPLVPSVSVVLPELLMAKTQYVATEPLLLKFTPFFDTVNNQYVTTGLDSVTLTIKKPDDTLLTPAPTPVFDGDTFFWEATVAVGEFQAGDWLIKAESDAANTLPQFRIFTWGDYVDKIVENNQAAFGRWKIESNQLTIYASDGVTPLRVFDLLDENGLPTQTRIFERDPV